MRSPSDRVGNFLDELMLRRKRLPSQLAAELGVSHTTIGRWLQGKDIPSTKSCQRLADYSGVRLEFILRVAGHLPSNDDGEVIPWSEEHSKENQVSSLI